MSKCDKTITITNKLGLHARAAAKLIRLSEGFTSSIKLIKIKNSISADARSISSILALSASKGTILKLEIEGLDEGLAFDAIVKLFENGFGELIDRNEY